VFAGFRFPREVIAVAVRWYLRYGLSYRDVEELLAERGIEVDHVTVYRWVQTLDLGVYRRRPRARGMLCDDPCVDRCPVGSDLDRSRTMSERAGEERPCHSGIAAFGDQHIDDLAVLVDRTAAQVLHERVYQRVSCRDGPRGADRLQSAHRTTTRSPPNCPSTTESAPRSTNSHPAPDNEPPIPRDLSLPSDHRT